MVVTLSVQTNFRLLYCTRVCCLRLCTSSSSSSSRKIRELVCSLCAQGRLRDAISILGRPGIQPDYLTYTCLVQKCGNSQALAEARLVHAQILDRYPASDASRIVLGNHLIRMFDKCGSPQDALRAFELMHQRNLVSWNLMIAAYAHAGLGHEAFHLFVAMHRQDVQPDKFTFISVISACTRSTCLEEGKLVHTFLLGNRTDSDVAVGNALLTMYCKCGSIQDTKRTFETLPDRDVVSWNAMIASYCQYGHAHDALHLYKQMLQEGTEPDKVTFITILTLCAAPSKLSNGKAIHAFIHETGIQLDVILGTALVDMYSKCGDLEAAYWVFGELPARNVVSWTTIISAFLQHGYAREALQHFQQMLREGLKPNKVTFLTILDTCATLGALADGMLVHACIVEDQYTLDIAIQNALVNMYSHCGTLQDASRFFNNMAVRDVVSWNAIIAAHSHHGYGYKALKLFQQMLLEGMKPTHITFIAVLSACSREGLLSDGLMHFDFMYQDHEFVPTAQHYRCMVDLLSRVGQLDKAEDCIDGMPFQPGVMEWMCLLSACRVQGSVDGAIHAAQYALELDPQNTGAYMVLSNILAAIGSWEDAANVKKLMVDRGMRKAAAYRLRLSTGCMTLM